VWLILARHVKLNEKLVTTQKYHSWTEDKSLYVTRHQILEDRRHGRDNCICRQHCKLGISFIQEFQMIIVLRGNSHCHTINISALNIKRMSTVNKTKNKIINSVIVIDCSHNFSATVLPCRSNLAVIALVLSIATDFIYMVSQLQKNCDYNLLQ